MDKPGVNSSEFSIKLSEDWNATRENLYNDCSTENNVTKYSSDDENISIKHFPDRSKFDEFFDID